MNVREWIKSYSTTDKERTERAQTLMLDRLNGLTLQQIGEKYGGLSRERIRQVLAPMVASKPELDEDKSEALYWFKKYAFLKYKHFNAMFGLPEETYRYFEIFYYYDRDKTTSKKDIRKDKKMTPDLLNKYDSLSQHSKYYRDNNWHEVAMQNFKEVFDTNPHNRLTVLDVIRKPVAGVPDNYRTFFKCRCECGNEVIVSTNNLPRTKSCGCLKHECGNWVNGKRGHMCRNVDTGEIFNSITEASEKYGVSVSSIYSACNGRAKTIGGYRWEYVSEPDLYPNAVRCVETGVVYPSISQAQKATNNKNVSAVLQGIAVTAGGYHWEFVDKSKNKNIRGYKFDRG